MKWICCLPPGLVFASFIGGKWLPHNLVVRGRESENSLISFARILKLPCFSFPYTEANCGPWLISSLRAPLYLVFLHAICSLLPWLISFTGISRPFWGHSSRDGTCNARTKALQNRHCNARCLDWPPWGILSPKLSTQQKRSARMGPTSVLSGKFPKLAKISSNQPSPHFSLYLGLGHSNKVL